MGAPGEVSSRGLLRGKLGLCQVLTALPSWVAWAWGLPFRLTGADSSALHTSWTQLDAGGVLLILPPETLGGLGRLPSS